MIGIVGGTAALEGSVGIARGAGGLAGLYERHSVDAVRLAYLLTGDRDLAEDLAQDAFVRVAGRFRGLRKPEAFRAYLRRAVINQANSHFRRARVERTYLVRQGTAAIPGPAALPDLAVRDELRAALLALPLRQRAAIVLRYYEDLSEQQAADVLGCSPGAIKSLVARGMATLRNLVRGEDQ